MDEGMLWFDNDPKSTLAKKVERAVQYYREKYGTDPNICLVHPSALKEGQEMPPIAVRPYRPVLPNHFWLGIETVGE